MDIETNDIKYKIVEGFVTMQPLAIHPRTQEVRYLLVQKEQELVLIDCEDFTS
jgi:hypothetical protein